MSVSPLLLLGLAALAASVLPSASAASLSFVGDEAAPLESRFAQWAQAFNKTYATPGGCSRVCDKRADFVVELFVIEAICIGAFTAEFLLRLWASPAAIGRSRRIEPNDWGSGA